MTILVMRAAAVAGVPTTYSTLFNTTEVPLSEGGKWQGGLTDGLDFSDIEVAGGISIASRFNNAADATNYADSVAIIKATACDPGADQFAEVIVSMPDGAYSPNTSHELELLLRGNITAHSAQFYEFTMQYGTSTPQFFLQPGNIGGFVPITTSGGFPRGIQDGDVIRGRVHGSSFVFSMNGTDYMSATDGTLTGGRPGLGHFIRPDGNAVKNKYGAASWNCGPN